MPDNIEETETAEETAEMVTCEHCNEKIEKENANTDPNGDYICGDCEEEKVCECEHCNGGCFKDDCTDVENSRQHPKYVCAKCFERKYFKCEDCNKYTYDSGCGYSEITNCSYCEDCYNALFTECSECNCEMLRHYSDCDTCEDCRERENESKEIKDYSYKPDIVYYGKAKDNLYFGIELEVEGKGDLDTHAERVNNYSHLYCKHDGSLTHGFEIVSHPMSWEFLKENREDFKTLTEKLVSSGFKSYDTTTCGLHIHISKKALSALQIYKIQKFIYENSEFIFQFSKRTRHSINQYAKLDDLERSTAIAINSKLTKSGGVNLDRYNAVNLNNKHTIEFRFFRGTLKLESIYKNLQFVHALVAFTKEFGIAQINVSSFRTFVMNSKEYPDLKNWFTVGSPKDK